MNEKKPKRVWMRKFYINLVVDIHATVWGKSEEDVRESLEGQNLSDLITMDNVEVVVQERPDLSADLIEDGVVIGYKWITDNPPVFEDERGLKCLPSDSMADYPEEKRGSAEHQAILEAQGQMRLFAEPEKLLISQGDTEEEG